MEIDRRHILESSFPYYVKNFKGAYENGKTQFAYEGRG